MFDSSLYFIDVEMQRVAKWSKSWTPEGYEIEALVSFIDCAIFGKCFTLMVPTSKQTLAV